MPSVWTKAEDQRQTEKILKIRFMELLEKIAAMFTGSGGCFDVSNPIGTADQEWIFACNCEGLNDHSTRTMDYSSLKTGLQPINYIKTGRSTCRFLYNTNSQQKHPNDHRKHQRDPRGGIEEETFRNDVDEHVGAWIEDPQIIVEKDFVENNEIF